MQADKQPRTGAAVRVLRALKGMGRATKQQLAQATAGSHTLLLSYILFHLKK